MSPGEKKYDYGLKDIEGLWWKSIKLPTTQSELLDDGSNMFKNERKKKSSGFPLLAPRINMFV